MKTFAGLLLGLACLLTACQEKKTAQKQTDSAQPGTVRLRPETFSYREGRCDSVVSEGVAVRASYGLLDDESEAARIINDTLRNYLIRAVVSYVDSADLYNQPEAQTDLNAAARLFAKGYRDLRAEFPDTPVGGCWELESKGDTMYTSPKLISVRLETYAYTGGAHPNTHTTLYTFDRQTGRALRLADLVTDTTAVRSLVEAAFRKKQGLQPEQNLESEGYFLREGQFFLPENVAAGREGLIFYYNPYEIAAYALGPIELVVPYSQLPLAP